MVDELKEGEEVHITIDIVNVKEGATVLSRLLVRDLPLHIYSVRFRSEHSKIREQRLCEHGH